MKSASRLRCVDCGIPTDRTFRLCPTCLGKRNARESAAQGLPEFIEDPAVIDRLDRLTRHAAPEREDVA